MRMRVSKILLGSLLLIAPALAMAGTSRPYGNGGWIADFQPVLDQHNAGAELLFHAGHDRQRNVNARSTQRMLDAYNASLRQYVIANHYMDTLEFHRISGADIIDKFGYRECPRR